MFDRLRRLRRTPELRRLVRETVVQPSNLIYPIFVSEAAIEKEPINSMPGQYRLPLGEVAKVAKRAALEGLGGILIFGLPKTKDDQATAACDSGGIVQRAIQEAKTTDVAVITDVCVCSYTPHGHCGLLKGDSVDNDSTLEILAAIAVSHAEAGADIVAPSSMMDGQTLAIRNALDDAGFADTGILSYAAKFHSAFYGPFREAADSAPAFGDRSSYQHDAANIRHAQREIFAEVEEGADILMIKPGLAYLDVVKLARESTDLPVAVYNVSGEYSMVKAAAERGWLDEKKAVLETLTAFKRAGADMIVTYHAWEAADWLKDN